MNGFEVALAYGVLGVFWLNTLLVAGAAWGECGRLLRAWGREARRGLVVEGTGPGGQIAVHRVRQVGRAGGEAIHFHDRAHVSEVFGGTIAFGAERKAVGAGSVWPGRARQEQAAACPDDQAFARARPAAGRAAGWERSVEVAFGTGEPIWLSEGPEGPLLAESDPRGWRRKVAGLTAALVVGVLAMAAGCTVLCLWPPVFGTVSKLGAFAALVAFNLIQLFGKLHRDAIQPPSSLALRGVWRLGGQ